MKQRGWDVLWRAGVPSAHTAGVANLTKKSIPISPISPSTKNGTAAFAAGRLMLAAVSVGDGANVVYVINVYAQSGQQSGQREKREALIETAFREAAALGNVAIAIGGDWNACPTDSSSVCTALCSGR